VSGEPELFEAIHALCSPGGLARGLDGRQKQGHEDANDGNDDEQLDKRKRGALPGYCGSSDEHECSMVSLVRRGPIRERNTS
jgi:hypothetical protein